MLGNAGSYLKQVDGFAGKILHDAGAASKLVLAAFHDFVDDGKKRSKNVVVVHGDPFG